MKKSHFILMLTATLFLTACNAEKQSAIDNDSLPDSYRDAEGLYHGLEPPGMVSKSLDQDIVYKEGWKLGGVHAQKMKEFYLTSTSNAPFRPLVVSFREENRVLKKYDFYATGSDTLYSKDKYIIRTEDGWSKIKSLGAPMDTIPIMRLTASSNGTLVFDEFTRDGNGVLRYSRLVNGKREAPKPLSAAINTGKWNAHPFIALDESYIIWDGEREDGYGDSDMYISFKQSDGSWGPAINFGDEINTDGEDGGGYVTPDGKYLSYCPRCKPPYDRMWVDAQIIADLRTQNQEK